MKVLVTGGAGFTGVHLVRALVDRGDDVTVLDVSSGDSLDTDSLKAQGVKLIKLDEGDKLVALAKVAAEEDEKAESAESPAPEAPPAHESGDAPGNGEAQ